MKLSRQAQREKKIYLEMQKIVRKASRNVDKLLKAKFTPSEIFPSLG